MATKNAFPSRNRTFKNELSMSQIQSIIPVMLSGPNDFKSVTINFKIKKKKKAQRRILPEDNLYVYVRRNVTENAKSVFT